MIGKAVRWLVLVGGAVAVVTTLPDVERYLRMREMDRPASSSPEPASGRPEH